MSNPPKNGGPAFPRPVSFSNEGGTHYGQTGMSRRDWFAGQALAGLLASGHFTYPEKQGPEDEPGVISATTPVLDDNGEETGKKKTHLLAVEQSAIVADFMLRELVETDER